MKYEQIRNIVIIALASDDNLVEKLVLKGGNAIHILHKDKEESLPRSSFDLDYSIENDFDGDLQEYERRIQATLVKTFNEHNLVIFDYKFTLMPSTMRETLKDFWGGYYIEFKIITKEIYDSCNGNMDKVRRLAIPVLPNNSPRIEIGISKYEYVGKKIETQVEGYLIYIYSPEMIVFEKLRAICQQLPQYREVIPSHTPRPRAKDFYDIYLICTQHEIDEKSEEIKRMINTIFKAKKVPLEYVKQIRDNSNIHSENWQTVKETVSAKEDIKEFDFYLKFLLNKFENVTFP